MIRRLALVFVCWPALVYAQPAPLVGTTLRTTSTAAGSVRVGCTESGLCTGGIVAGPVDVASVTSGGFVGIADNVPISTTMRLYNDGGTLKWNGVALDTGGSSVSGTPGKLAVFTGAASVGNSICTESGSTLTCVNTLAATTGTFTNVAGTLTTANQGSITSVGTLIGGTWNSTKIGLAYGGTNADLSGTGGTSQFLRQATVGGAVTVVRPAVADLSDAANVALLNAVNTFTAQGTHTWSSAVAGTNAILLASPTADAASRAIFTTQSGTGATAYASHEVIAGTTTGGLFGLSQGYTTSEPYTQAGLSLVSNGAGGLSLAAVHASGPISLYTGGTGMRWGITAAGDWTYGASGHIADSSGIPTIASNFGTGPAIAGTDYAIKITVGTGASTTTSTVNFGHTWTSAPVCSVSIGAVGITIAVATSATVLTLAPSADWSGKDLFILCRGY